MKRTFLPAFLTSACLAGSSHATLVFVPIDLTGLAGTGATSGSSNIGFAEDNAIDGNFGNFTHTATNDPNPEWSVNLGADQTFNAVLINNRSNCCPERLSDVSLELFSSTSTSVYASGNLNPGNALGSPGLITHSFPSATARSLSIYRDGASTIGTQGIMSLGEVRIGTLTDSFLPSGTNLTQASLLGMTVAQGPTSASPPGGGVAGNAVDGNFGNFTHTNANVNTNHFFELNLGSLLRLEEIDIANRTSCCGERLRDITVTILDEGGLEVFNSGLLNPGNAEGFSGANPGGLTLDLVALTGGAVDGQTVLVTRTTDAVGPNGDDRSVLSIGELTVTGGSIPIPEPSAVLLSLLGLGICLRRRR